MVMNMNRDGSALGFEKTDEFEYKMTINIAGRTKIVCLSEHDIVEMYADLVNGKREFSDKDDYYNFTVVNDSNDKNDPNRTHMISVLDTVRDETYSLNVDHQNYINLVKEFQEINDNVNLPFGRNETIVIGNIGEKVGREEFAKWTDFRYPDKFKIKSFTPVGSDAYGNPVIRMEFKPKDAYTNNTNIKANFVKAANGWHQVTQLGEDKLVISDDIVHVYDIMRAKIEVKIRKESNLNVRNEMSDLSDTLMKLSSYEHDVEEDNSFSDIG